MPLNYQLFYQRHLPHYQPAGAILFITFRLAGSLPQAALQRLDEEKRRLKAEILQNPDLQISHQAVYLAQKKLFGTWDAELDHSKQGPQWLAEPRIAGMVCDALKYRDGTQYTLEAYCIMPNHVHMVFAPLVFEGASISLSKIMHSLKGYTAREANRVLGRQGDFWQHESYDHAVRDEAELIRIVEYVRLNPSRVGLPETWVYCRTS